MYMISVHVLFELYRIQFNRGKAHTRAEDFAYINLSPTHASFAFPTMKLLRQGFIAICFLPVLALCGLISNVVNQGRTLFHIVLPIHRRILANEKPRYLVLSAPHGGPEIFEAANSLAWSISGIFQWVVEKIALDYAKSSESFAGLRSTLEQTVTTTREVILDLEERVSQQGSNFNSTALNERFAETVNKAQEKFEEIFRSFGEDEPADREEADRRRREAVARALDCVENVFVDTVCELWAVSEDEPRERFRQIRAQVERVVDVVSESDSNSSLGLTVSSFTDADNGEQ